jgi:SAM-dependent methyltransferase
MFKLWFDNHAQEFAGSDVLHIAPEKSVADLFRPLSRTYISMDIEADRADTVGNIEDLQFADAAFSCVICSHVLEHVDDRKALGEMHRVLRPGGVAIILVPVVEAWAHTYENPAIRTSPERQLHFGQKDHVRIYGADLRERIREADFCLTEFTAEEPDVSTLGLVRGDKIFLGRRSA